MPRPVLITGCSSGIGWATAAYLAQRGVPVYATVRTDADRDCVGSIPGVEAFVCDVTDDGQVAALRAAIDQRGDGLCGIVHNAGIGYLGHLTTTPLEAMKQVFEVNVFVRSQEGMAPGKPPALGAAGSLAAATTRGPSAWVQPLSR